MMESEVSSWNDDRLDELNRRVDEGFVRVDERFVLLEGEMKGSFAKVDREMKEGFAELRGEMRYLGERFDRLGERFDRLLNTLVLIAWGFAGTLVAALAAVLVAALT
jgi:hypothetical protein